jgi:hypothetical protein
MQVYRFPSALLVLAGSLVAGCNNDRTPTDPATSGAEPLATPIASLVGKPNTWEQVAPMPSARHSVAMGQAENANGRSIVYVFGGTDVTDPDGFDQFRSVEKYNIDFDNWATKAALSPFELSGISGATKIGGKFYLPGGRHNTGSGDEKLRVLQVYDPRADAWTRGSDMPRGTAFGISGAIDGQLYVLTGDENIIENGEPCPDCGTVETRRLFRYDPVQDRWFLRKACPHFHSHGVAGVIGGKLYVTGGRGQGRTTQNLDIYDPVTDTWSSGAPLPNPHVNAGGVVLGGQFYVIGGFTSEVVAYNPESNRWVRKASFPVIGNRDLSAAKATLNGKARIVVQVGIADNFADEGRATFVYTP